jgi:hypothetical protein
MSEQLLLQKETAFKSRLLGLSIIFGLILVIGLMIANLIRGIYIDSIFHTEVTELRLQVQALTNKLHATDTMSMGRGYIQAMALDKMKDHNWYTPAELKRLESAMIQANYPDLNSIPQLNNSNDSK